MKLNVVVLFVTTLLMADIAQAQMPTVTRTGPNGKTLALKLDGKYSTCLRDSQRLGWPYDSAKRYCDAKPNLTR
jgi:hypothetical protein